MCIWSHQSNMHVIITINWMKCIGYELHGIYCVSAQLQYAIVWIYVIKFWSIANEGRRCGVKSISLVHTFWSSWCLYVLICALYRIIFFFLYYKCFCCCCCFLFIFIPFYITALTFTCAKNTYGIQWMVECTVNVLAINLTKFLT